MIDFANNFRKTRLKAGLTQESLAMGMGTHTSTINRIENGKRKIDLDMINKFAVAVDKSFDEVLRDLNGLTSNSNVQESRDRGVNAENSEFQLLVNLYERLLLVKDDRIRILENELRQFQKKKGQQ